MLQVSKRKKKSLLGAFERHLRSILYWSYSRSEFRYQPVGAYSAARNRPESSFEARLKIARSAVSAYGIRHVLDIGCAEGFFIRNLALSEGVTAVGLEQSRAAIRRGSAIWDAQKEHGYGYIQMEVSPDALAQLPVFDLVICLSVVHHVIASGGKEAGVEFLRACATVTGKVFLFDMGSPLEKSHGWASSLAFLGSSEAEVAQNTASMLREAGFAGVEEVGESLGHKAEAMRPVFLCTPS